MRPAVLLGAVILGGGLIGAAIWLSHKLPLALSGDAVEVAITNTTHSPAPKSSITGVRAREIRPAESVSAPTTGPVASILADLQSPERETRRAALQRARELDDPSIIPSLRAFANQTPDSDERTDILAAIDFLNLPSVADNVAAAQAARAQSGQPNPPRATTNRWTGRVFGNQ